jgi:hypothetical protein
MLSLCLILTSGPLMAAYTCNNSMAAAAVSDYEIAEQNMNTAIAQHVANVDGIVQPVQAALEWVGGSMIVTGHGIEGLGRATVASITHLIREAQRTGQCVMDNAKKYRLFGTVNCAIVAGGNVILVSAAALNAGVTTVEFVIVGASDVFFNGAIRASNVAAGALAANGAQGLALPFIVISKVLKAGQWVVGTSVGIVAAGVRSFVTFVGDVFCNLFSGISHLLAGDARGFLKIMIAGTVGIVAQWVKNIIDILIVQPIRAVGGVIRDIVRSNAHLQGPTPED